MNNITVQGKLLIVVDGLAFNMRELADNIAPSAERLTAALEKFQKEILPTYSFDLKFKEYKQKKSKGEKKRQRSKWNRHAKTSIKGTRNG